MNKRCLGCMQEYGTQYELCPHCGTVVGSPAKEPYHLPPGTCLQKKYLIGHTLGYGGFGVTYLAWDMTADRAVAIKEYLPAELSTRVPGSTQTTIFSDEKGTQFQAGKEKFYDEAQKLAALGDTPGIVKIYDTFPANGTAYIVMEHLKGETLRARLQREDKLAVSEGLRIIEDVLAALIPVHKQGLIHRDISPENIFLCEDGSVKLMDFGASRYASAGYSKSLSVILKPGFAPEEQYRSHGEQGPWSDVYAAAATLYCMLTGATPLDTMERLSNDRMKDPDKLNPQIPKHIANAILNGMNLYKEDRTPSPEAMLQELLDTQNKRRQPKKQKKAFVKWPLWVKVALPVLLCVAVGLTAFLFRGPATPLLSDDEVYVPEVVNLDAETAATLLAQQDLVLQITDQQHSSKVEKNRIMGQDPDAGTIQTRHTEIHVVISKGNANAVVPDLTGLEKEAAEQLLLEMGFQVRYDEQESAVRQGHICAQSVLPNTLHALQEPILLTVSLGLPVFEAPTMVRVPDFVGQHYQDALAELQALGLHYVKGETRESNRPAGEILSQSVPAQSEVLQGTEIQMVISAGNHVMMPDLQYRPEATAIDELKALGLSYDIHYEYSQSVAQGRVIRQGTAPQISVVRGDTVSLFISLGRAPSGNNTPANANPPGNNSQNSSSNTGGTASSAKPTPTAPPASWSAWTADSTLAGNNAYQVETRTEYRSRSYQYLESTNPQESGWEKYDESVTLGDFGSWSDWSPAAVAASDTREVETREVCYQASYTKTTYHYWRYWDENQQKWQYRFNDIFGGTHYTKSSTDANFRADDDYFGYTTYVCDTPIFYDEVWFVQGTEIVPEITGTEYRYRDRTVNAATYYHRKWSAWSAWQTSPIAPQDGCQVETQTLYRYKAK